MTHKGNNENAEKKLMLHKNDITVTIVADVKL